MSWVRTVRMSSELGVKNRWATAFSFLFRLGRRCLECLCSIVLQERERERDSVTNIHVANFNFTVYISMVLARQSSGSPTKMAPNPSCILAASNNDCVRFVIRCFLHVNGRGLNLLASVFIFASNQLYQNLYAFVRILLMWHARGTSYRTCALTKTLTMLSMFHQHLINVWTNIICSSPLVSHTHTHCDTHAILRNTCSSQLVSHTHTLRHTCNACFNSKV